LILDEQGCRACAACCRDASDGRIPVDAADIERLKRASREDVVAALVPGHFGLSGMPADASGQCLFLGLADRPLDCSIYEHRPASCRALAPGSPQCLAYRRVDAQIKEP
jgi:Fe-S-cluster containining protein